MRFKVDENLPVEACRILRDRGHDATDVFDEDLDGATDDRIAEACREEKRALVTLDLDFANIQAYPPSQSAGIIVLRLGHQDKPSAIAAVRSMLPVLEREALDKRLWIVEEDRIRVRA